MKTASDEFEAQLASDVTTLKRLWRLTAAGRGTVYLTDHQEPITYDGNVYLSAGDSFDCSAIDNQLGAGQTNFSINVLLGGVFIREDCERGIWSGAKIFIDAIFYDHIDYGVMPLATGAVSGVELPDRFSAEFSCSGFASTGEHYLTEQYTPTCRAQFCDSRCTLDIADFTTPTCTVDAVSGTLSFTSTDVVSALHYYDLGFVTWLTGANEGRKSEVQFSQGGVIKLLIRPPFQIAENDTFDISRGCTKTVAACEAYANKLNFRGEPYVPGSDYVVKPVRSKPPAKARQAPAPLGGGWAVP